MKLPGLFVLFFAGVVFAETPAAGPAQSLYDSGMRLTVEGKLADARTSFQDLIDLYPHNPLAIDAKGAIDATLLFEEGQARAKAGKFQTAHVAFETLIEVYPDNPLVDRAKTVLAAIDSKDRGSETVLQSVEFRHVAAVSVDEIRAQLDAREVRLTVGQPYRSKDVRQAKLALEEILAENGAGHVKIEARTRSVAPHQVAVIFTVEKPHSWIFHSRQPAAGAE